MVKSKNFSFEVKILQKLNDDQSDGEIRNASYEPLRELLTPLGLYVVAQPNQEFIIELKANDQKVYGAKLWIDEQEIFYKKTFKSRGFYMGFKLGEGKFNAFKFAPPIYESKDLSVSQLKKSEIKIQFYRTSEKLVSDSSYLNKSIRKAQDLYVPGSVKDNKKFFRKSLTVQPGEVLYKPNLDRSVLMRRAIDYKTKKYKQNVIHYDDVLDTIVFNYGDFNSLLIQGVLSLANYDHLNVVPVNELKRKPKIVERIMMTIIRKYDKKGGLNLEQIDEEFRKLLRRPFEALEVGSLVTFISTRHQMFSLDNNERLKCSETAKNIYLDLKGVNPEDNENCIVPQNYFQTNFENGLKYKDSNSFSKSPGKPFDQLTNTINNNKKPIFIDLTLE